MIWYMLMPVLRLWSWVTSRNEKYLLMNVEYVNVCIADSGDEYWDALLDYIIEWAVNYNGHAGGSPERMLFDFKVLPNEHAINALAIMIKTWALTYCGSAFVDIREVTMSELDEIYGT